MGNIFEAAARDEATLRAALADRYCADADGPVAVECDLQILDEVAPHIHGACSFLESVPKDLKQKVRDRLSVIPSFCGLLA